MDCISVTVVVIYFIKFLQVVTFGGRDFPGRSDDKESACTAGDPDSIPKSRGSEDPLEKEMASHSGILVWEIPWTEEPGRLQYMGRKESDRT